MTFSDEDLKRLKDSFYPTGPWNIECKDGKYITLQALLARLEAAEAFIDSVCRNDATVKQDGFLQAWRKACGK